MAAGIRAVLVVVAAASCAGCGTIAHAIWPCPAEVAHPPGARESPDEAIDFLVDAFRNHRTGDIYASFHPDFVAENGGFSQGDFALAYEKWESEFQADAENMAAARRTVKPRGASRVELDLENPATGAFFPIELENRPKLRVVTTNAFVGTLEGAVDVHALVVLRDGKLALPPELPLAAITGASPESLAALKPSQIVRVEFADDWVVRSIDPARARNIRFLEKIKESTQR